MPFEEKLTWVFGVVTAVVAAIYFATVLGRVGDAPVSEIAYQKPMLIAIGVAIAVTIVGTILAAIGTAISAEVTGNGSVDEIDRKDERDVHVKRRGELVGYYVLSAGMVAALVLTMLDVEHFWIANTLFLTFVVASLVSSAVKLVAYRRGF